MKPAISVIVPTYNNPQFLNPMINSMLGTYLLNGLGELIIVNNGSQPIKEYVGNRKNIRVLEPGKNLGWEGGLKYGLEHSDAEFVCFQNDDVLIPKATQDFYEQLLWPFNNLNVAAVGPSTTNAAGWHSVFLPNPLRTLSEVTYLIFFTVMVRRKYLDEVGGIDTTAPGGDDLDLSIRFRKAGKKLLINPDAFLIHHAFKTGERVRGTPDKPGGWNSKEMTDKTNKWLIQKHGFKSFMETLRGMDYQYVEPSDLEGEVVASYVRGPNIIELGCGARKTVPQAVGIDIAPNGESSNFIKESCVADIQADVSKPLPLEDGSVDTIIARHILEHMIDTVEVLNNWKRVLKDGGRLIIAVPNQDLRNTIPLNPEHCHAFTPESLKNVMELCGFKSIGFDDPKNGISFVGVFEKIPVLEIVNA